MKKVLVVEDEATQGKLTTKLLDNINCPVVLATRGEEALNILKEKKDNIGLIFLDLSLPDIGGLRLLGELKKNNINIPAAILSINEDIATVVEAMKAGADNYFIKFSGGEKELVRLYEYVSKNIGIKL